MTDTRGWRIIRSSTRQAGDGSELAEDDETMKCRSLLSEPEAAGAAAAMLPASAILTAGTANAEERSGRLGRGDAAVLRFPDLAEGTDDARRLAPNLP
jgi:hypothetical protein